MNTARVARHACMSCLTLAPLLVGSVPRAAAQDPDRPSPVIDILTRVALDPTTYAPAALAYEAHHLDWKSSQVLFQHPVALGHR